MKITGILILSGFFAVSSCTQNEKEGNSKSVVKTVVPKIIENVSYDQLIGVWEVTEQRKDPQIKGVQPHPMEDGILYAFHENGRFMTTSMGIDYLKDVFGFLGMKVTVKEGKIKSTEKSDLYDNQWGKNGIEIYKINQSELVLKFKTFKQYENPYLYLEKIKI